MAPRMAQFDIVKPVCETGPALTTAKTATETEAEGRLIGADADSAAVADIPPTTVIEPPGGWDFFPVREVWAYREFL